MLTRRFSPRSVLALVAAASALATSVALAGPTSRPATTFFTDSHGVAVKGYDVVSYFDGKAEKGKADFAAEYEGATFHFVSADHLAAFKADPQKFAPQYGGFCAYGVAEGHKAPTDPHAFTVVDGKLYLNYNKGVAAGWNKNRAEMIQKADANWPRIINDSIEH